VSRYPALAPIDDFILLFLPPCNPHLTPLATGSLESGLLVSPLLGGPAKRRPFAPTLHLHQRKSSRNLHLQFSTKSQSTPRCQSLITARSDHPPVLGRSGPHQWRKAVRQLASRRAPLATDQGPSSHHARGKKGAQRMDHRTRVGLGVRAQRVPGAGARDAGATARSGRQGNNSSDCPPLIEFFSIFSNRSGPRFLYQSCRPCIAQQLL
jgi:hypothetical protein